MEGYREGKARGYRGVECVATFPEHLVSGKGSQRLPAGNCCVLGDFYLARQFNKTFVAAFLRNQLGSEIE
jgi:hypothetical protein